MAETNIPNQPIASMQQPLETMPSGLKPSGNDKILMIIVVILLLGIIATATYYFSLISTQGPKTTGTQAYRKEVVFPTQLILSPSPEAQGELEQEAINIDVDNGAADFIEVNADLNQL